VVDALTNPVRARSTGVVEGFLARAGRTRCDDIRTLEERLLNAEEALSAVG